MERQRSRYGEIGRRLRAAYPVDDDMDVDDRIAELLGRLMSVPSREDKPG